MNKYCPSIEHSTINFKVETIELESRGAAIDWIINNQLGRRNLTLEQISYYRGLQYEREKLKHGRPGKSDHFDHLKTANRLAKQHKVAEPTIRRDAQYAKAVDKVAKVAGGDARKALLSRETKISKQDAVKLAKIAEVTISLINNWITIFTKAL